MPTVGPDILAVLKAKAHLNLREEKRVGHFVSDHELAKHRNDVFQLAYLFRGRYEGELSQSIKKDIAEFLRLYSASNLEWTEIQAHLSTFRMEAKDPAELLQLIREHFNIG